jgi:hypothetical protein
VGTRIMTGFSTTTWNETLDLAGYPRTSRLPADWVWPAPTPLTDAKPAQPAATQTGTPPPSESPR